MSQLSTYGRKYYMEWYDDKGVNNRLDIFWDGYVGAAIEVIGSDSPLSITQRDDESFNSPIQSTTFDITFLTDEKNGLTFRDLIVLSEREYYVEWHRIENAVDKLQFRGFLIPSESMELLKPDRAPFTISVSDMLGNLEDYTMDERFPPYKSFVLTELFDMLIYRLGLNFHLNDMSGWSAWTTDFQQTCLTQLEIRTDAFYADGSAISLKSAIETVLNALNCVMFQYGGEVYIAHKFGWGSKTSTWLNFRKEYTDWTLGTGAFLKTEPTRRFVSIPTQLEPLGNSMECRILPPFKKVIRSYKCQPRNIMFNNSFEDETGGTINAAENWDINIISRGLQQGLIGTLITDERSVGYGEKSLKLIGIPSKTLAEVHADLLDTNLVTRIASQDLSQTDWGITTLSISVPPDVKNSEGTLSISFYPSMNSADQNSFESITLRAAIRSMVGGTAFYYDEDTSQWRQATQLNVDEGVVNFILEEDSQKPNTWHEMSKNIVFTKECDNIFVDIYCPEYVGTAGFIDLFVDNCSLTVSPSTGSQEDPSKESSYYNLTYDISDFSISGEFKQEMLFMVTDTNVPYKKTLTGEMVDVTTNNIPQFKWYYEDSTTKSEDLLEIQSGYQLSQFLSIPVRRYSFTAYNNLSTQITKLDTLSLDLTRRDELDNLAVGSITYEGASGTMNIEAYTCISINSSADSGNPTEPSVSITNAEYLSSAIDLVTDSFPNQTFSCAQAFQGNSDFRFVGGDINSLSLLYVESPFVLNPPTTIGEWFYLKIGNNVRVFTYNHGEQRYYPYSPSSIICS